MSISGIFRTRSLSGQAGAFVLGAILVPLTLSLRVYLDPKVTYPGVVFLVPAILLASAVGGLRAGLFTTLIACVCADYFLLPPLGSFGVISPFQLMDMAALALTGVFIGLICELLRKTIQSMEAANAELAHAHRTTAQLAAIVEGSSDAIIGKDLEGFITSWNTSSETIFGYSSAEAIGSHVSKLIPPGLLAEERAIRAEVALGHTVSAFETLRLRKDGSAIDVSVTISPVRDTRGVITGASTTLRDISERKRIEKESQSARATLEAALRSMTDAVFISDANGKFVQVNDAFATYHRFRNVQDCLTSLESYPVLFEALTTDHQRVPFDQWPISRALKGEVVVGDELVVRRTDTGETWVGSYTFAPIRDRDGKITGTVGMARDITEQKKNAARFEAMRGDLARAGRLNELGQVSAGLAHELNQPLAAMLNYSNVAKRLIASGTPASLENARDAIAKASDQATRAGEIIRRMRAYIERHETHRAPECMKAIVDDAMAVALIGVKAEGITTCLKLAPDTPPVFADRVQIQQVLVNLLRNAVEAMADSPKRELTVSTTSIEDSAVEIVVMDSGPGIQKEIADKLFLPFVSSKPGGMGIGLVISQSIVEAHGGRIQVESDPGIGTRFYFRLPTAPVAPEPAAA